MCELRVAAKEAHILVWLERNVITSVAARVQSTVYLLHLAAPPVCWWLYLTVASSGSRNYCFLLPLIAQFSLPIFC